MSKMGGHVNCGRTGGREGWGGGEFEISIYQYVVVIYVHSKTRDEVCMLMSV